MKKLKNMDFKALFINHGEKFGLAVIVLFVLFALSGTSWSRFEKSPDELDAKVKEAKARITSPQNVWPQAKKDQYVVVDFSNKADEIYVGLQNSGPKYEFTTPMFWPLYRKKEKAREPDFLAPQYLIADAGVAILQMNKVQNLENPDEAKPDGKKSDLDDPNYKDPNLKDPGVRPGPAGAAQGFAPPIPGPTGAAAYGITPSRPPASGPGAHGAGGANGAAMMEGMAGYGMSGMGGNVTARGVRYVAVRAVVPIKEQIEKAMKALNMNYADAQAAIMYTDFVLQRQTAIAGDDPWSGPWVTVSIENAKKVLRETDFDQDPVPYDLQDATITMPLPYRILRYWGDDATHPNIKHFQLPEEERKKEEKLYQKMVEEVAKHNLESRPKVEKKAFATEVNDVKGMVNSLMRDPEAMKMMSGIQQSMMEGGAKQMSIADLKSRLTASGRLILFRYFDFEVEPGLAYRYRLKLELMNPNFERQYDEVDNEAFTRGAYRTTDWSNISNPAIVPDTVNYFLTDVERDPLREEKHGKKPVATIAMYQAHDSLGTLLADNLKIFSIGQFIGEKKKSWILDPATPSFEEKEVQFSSEDMLVDASGDLELSPDAHPDLKLKADRGKKESKLGLLPEALVATGLGDLKELDPLSESRKKNALSKRVDDERRNFMYLQEQAKEDKKESRLEGAGYPGASAMGLAAPGEMPGMKSARKKTSSGAAGAGGAHGGGGGGGGGARSAPPGTGARSSRPSRD